MGMIYKISNNINNNLYIGQSINDNEKYFGSGKYIKNAIKKYGIGNFSKEILEYCFNGELNKKEKYWINYYDSYHNGYNLTMGGQSGWMLGCKHSDDTKKQISQKLKGVNNPFFNKKHSDETKQKISNSLKNSIEWNEKIKSKEHKEKLSRAQKGRKHTEKTKKKISDKNKGKKRSEETRQKMSKIQKELKPFLGKHHTEETKKKISDTHRGKIVSEETRQKMRKNNLGKKLSKETKEKITKKLQKKVILKKNNIIFVFSNTQEVSIFLNISIKKIQYYCRKKDLNNKYHIMYEEDNEK